MVEYLAKTVPIDRYFGVETIPDTQVQQSYACAFLCFVGVVVVSRSLSIDCTVLVKKTQFPRLIHIILD